MSIGDTHFLEKSWAGAAPLAAIWLLLDHARRRVIPNLATDRDPYERAIVVALFPRSVTLVEAIVRLGHDGFGREALTLDRALFELMLDSFWSAANPELAERRFVAHARFTQHLQRERSRLHPAIFGAPEPMDSVGAQELKALGQTFGKFRHRSRMGLSVSERVVAIQGCFEEQSGDRSQLLLTADVLNALSNSELHPSAWSLQRALRRVRDRDGAERLQFRADRRTGADRFRAFGGVVDVRAAAERRSRRRRHREGGAARCS